MSSAEKVVPLPIHTKLVCSACGAPGEGSCRCGAPYVSPGERAAAAVAANPAKSDRAIAAEIGVSNQTVRRARQSTGTNVTVAKRTGRDGKARKVPQTSKPKTPVLDRAREIVRPLVEANEPVKSRELQKEYGISHVQFETAVAAERARNEILDVIRAGETSSLSQAKIDLAISQRIKQLDMEFEQRVTERHQKLLENIWPRLKEREALADRVITSRKGLMERRTYIKILARLHPDTGGDAELFDLFRRLEALLLHERDCPTERLGLPRTAAEWEQHMRGKMQ